VALVSSAIEPFRTLYCSHRPTYGLLLGKFEGAGTGDHPPNNTSRPDDCPKGEGAERSEACRAEYLFFREGVTSYSKNVQKYHSIAIG
jgi:hypothetical protein